MLDDLNVTVPEKGLPSKPRVFIFLRALGSLTITSMVVVIVLVDVTAWIYQEVYFRIYKIPKVKRSDYVVITREKLKGLNVFQKWNCAYCEYANRVIIWVQQIAHQTEIYSCAIKYRHRLPEETYQSKFFEESKFSKSG
ncbi:hypothetical protein HY024_05115 [Candidatus Curtissbacteria bacterium]|nr:hypothetical protein [Candidatus Curtissbacteria bacterium]